MTDKVLVQDLRIKQAEIEEMQEVLNRKNQEAYFIKESLNKEYDKLNSLKEELSYRKELSNKICSEIDNIVNRVSAEAHTSIKEIRTKAIRKTIESELCYRVPQFSRISKGLPNDSKDSNFYQLVFENVEFKKDDKIHSFRIMKSTTFNDVKKVMCRMYKIDTKNDYAITDYLDAIINDEDQCIDEYLKSYSVFNNCFNFVFIENYKRRQKLSLIQEDRLKDNFLDKRRANVSVKSKGLLVNHDYDIVKRKISDIISEFPLLKIFLKKDEINSPIKELSISEKARNIETSFVMFIILILLYVFTLASIYGGKDIGRSLLTRNYLLNYFDNRSVNSKVSLFEYLTKIIGFNLLSDNKTQRTIINISNSQKNILKNVLNIDTDPELFSQNLNNYKLNNLHEYKLASLLNIIVYKSNAIDCDLSLLTDEKYANDLNLNACYNNVIQDDFFVNTESLKNINLNGFKKFKEKDSSNEIRLSNENNISYTFYNNLFSNIKSNFGNLNTKGMKASLNRNDDVMLYIIDLMNMIPINPNYHSYTLSGDYVNPDDDNNNYFMIDDYTRAIQVMFTLFNYNQNLYYSVNIVFYFPVTGNIIPGEVSINKTIYNIYNEYKTDKVSDGIRFTCIIILIVLLIYNTVIIYFNHYSDGKFFTELNSKLSKITLIIVVLYLVIFIIKVSNLNLSTYIESEGNLIVDGSYYMNYDIISRFLECILLIVLTVKLLYFISLNDFVRLFYYSLFYYFVNSLGFLIFTILVILIFSSIGYIIFGPYVLEFSTYTYSYLSVLLLSIGGINISEWIETNVFWAILFTICYYSFLLFIVFVVFISIYSETLRTLINSKGYPSDNITDSWTTYDYLRWLIFCLKTDKSRQLRRS